MPSLEERRLADVAARDAHFTPPPLVELAEPQVITESDALRWWARDRDRAAWRAAVAPRLPAAKRALPVGCGCLVTLDRPRRWVACEAHACKRK